MSVLIGTEQFEDVTSIRIVHMGPEPKPLEVFLEFYGAGVGREPAARLKIPTAMVAAMAKEIAEEAAVYESAKAAAE
jgi:hypothetical protein